MHIDAVGWGILASVVLLFGTPSLVLVLRHRANPDWVPPNEVVAFEFVGFLIIVFMPLICFVLPDPPWIGQPWLGAVELLYVVACYFHFWRIWIRTSDWRWRFCLLILFIFLPNYVWLLHVGKYMGARFPPWLGVVQVLYMFGGFFVFRHYFRKVR